MSILKNSRHEKFAQAVAKGEYAATAYVQAGYSFSGAAQAASRLARNVNVSARIVELKRNSESKAEAKADISRAEVVAILAEYARVHPMEYAHDIRLKAIAQLARMCGWDSADKVEHSANESLIEALKRLRGS